MPRTNKIVPKTKRERFEYFLNAVYYFIWTVSWKHAHFIEKSISKILTPVFSFIVEKGFPEDYGGWCMKNLRSHNSFVNDCLAYRKHSLSIPSGYRFYSLVIMGYSAPIYTPIAICILPWCTNKLGLILFLATVFIAYFALNAVCDRMVFKGDRFIKYFKKFDKEDTRWRRKWKWITALTITGSFIILILSLLLIVTNIPTR